MDTNTLPPVPVTTYDGREWYTARAVVTLFKQRKGVTRQLSQVRQTADNKARPWTHIKPAGSHERLFLASDVLAYIASPRFGQRGRLKGETK